VFVALRKLRAYVSGDIGCYSLGALEPFNAMHCSTCMGAGISMAHGMARVMGPEADARNRPVAVIGDSTFFHSGITSLLDVAYNRSNVVTVILDNRTTAMTGGQECPSMGKTLQGRDAPQVDIPALVRALGIKRVREVDPYDVAEVQAALKEEIAADEPSVVIATEPCVLEYRVKRPVYAIDPHLCTGCKVCLRAGCTALSLYKNDAGEPRVEIDPTVCNGCSVCSQLCRYEAIKPPLTDGKDA
jgi:indolepyruvate ferredoxin oxidoreductase alpha subunit